MPDRINDVRPFRALHYDPAVVGDIGPCLSQPYDVISPAQQEAYYRQQPVQRHPPDPEQGRSRRRRGEQPLHAGARPAGAVARERDPPCYGTAVVLGVRAGVRPPGHRAQDGEGLHRRGAAARLRGTADPPPREGAEGTAGGPDPARPRATNTQFEYIWSLYQDRAYVIDNILDEQAREPAIVDCVERPVGRAPPHVAPERSRRRCDIVRPDHGAPEDLHRRRPPPLPDHAHGPRPDAAPRSPTRGPTPPGSSS